jgi:protein-disulfide isomerase
MHPYAEKAAEAARCAGTQGKFWEFHDLLFVGKKLQPADLREQARTLNLDQERFDKCLVEGVEAAAVERTRRKRRAQVLRGRRVFYQSSLLQWGAYLCCAAGHGRAAIS